MGMKNTAGSCKKNKTKRSSSPLPAHITPQVTVTLYCKQANTPSPHFVPQCLKGVSSANTSSEVCSERDLTKAHWKILPGFVSSTYLGSGHLAWPTFVVNVCTGTLRILLVAETMEYLSQSSGHATLASSGTNFPSCETGKMSLRSKESGVKNL